MRNFHPNATRNETHKPRGMKMKVLEDMPGVWDWGDVDEYVRAVSQKFEVQEDQCHF